jgi:hypothetical protein
VGGDKAATNCTFGNDFKEESGIERELHYGKNSPSSLPGLTGQSIASLEKDGPAGQARG